MAFIRARQYIKLVTLLSLFVALAVLVLRDVVHISQRSSREDAMSQLTDQSAPSQDTTEPRKKTTQKSKTKSKDQSRTSETAEEKEENEEDNIVKEALDYWREQGVVTDDDETPGVVGGHVGTGDDPPSNLDALDDLKAYRLGLLIRRQHDPAVIKTRPVTVDTDGDGVVVMLHVQKTGGTTLENALVLHTNVTPPCSCIPMPDVPSRLMCRCENAHNQTWLFNRHSVGWPCGVHPSYTELISCLDAWFNVQANEDRRRRRYAMLTQLRDPVMRLTSEWLHVRRGATWKDGRLHCGGRDATEDEVPFCFEGEQWKNVSFDEFMSCESNMAFNRQTWMLADLTDSGCFKKEWRGMSRAARDERMLASAKATLAHRLAHFGLLELQAESQSLMEKRINGFIINTKLQTSNGAPRTNFITLSLRHWEIAAQRSHLDIRLYQFAKDLFLQRLEAAGIPVPSAEGARYVQFT